MRIMWESVAFGFGGYCWKLNTIDMFRLTLITLLTSVTPSKPSTAVIFIIYDLNARQCCPADRPVHGS